MCKKKLEEVVRTTNSGDVRSVPEPYDAEVVAARMALRHAYVALLLACPFTRGAQLVDSMIWADTTYSVIAALRGRLARLEREASAAPFSKGDAPKSERRSAKLSAFERVLRDLRRFIGEELAFYETLVARLIRLFDLVEARPMAEGLGLLRGASDEGTASPEALALAQVPAHRHQLFETLQRLLTYMGDLHRYREMHAMLPPALAPRRRNAGVDAVPHDFGLALRFYHEAHLLLPDHGNPSNQLAVVALFVGDTFGAMYQYYRALCVRVPFEKARFNLHRLLDTALESWLVDASRDDILTAWRQASFEDSPGHRVPIPQVSVRWDSAQAWLASFVQLHSMYALQVDLDVACVLNEALLRHLVMLTDAHQLRAVDYLRILVTGICASWTARLWRPPSTTRLPFSTGAPYSLHMDTATLEEHVRKAWETMLVAHVFGTLASLLVVVRQELVAMLRAQPPATEPRLLPVGRVLRRTLPAVRIGLKWVKGHLEYIHACRTHAAHAAIELQEAVDHMTAASSLASDGVARLACIQRSVDARCQAFWSALVDLVNLIRAAYPFDLLPNAHDVDESGTVYVHVMEDDDLRDLGPIRRTMHPCDESQYAVPTQTRADPAQSGSDYARILDVLVDAKVMAEFETSGLAYNDARGLFTVRVAEDAEDPIDLAMKAVQADRETVEARAWPASTWPDSNQALASVWGWTGPWTEAPAPWPAPPAAPRGWPT
ncbi:hypothetical protein MNAN1_003794 [Malassezia nana]|uniref:Uncharacterized protein n=1 Tax=Malassezia nana TaxID=180528 RepID=A0AAF0J4E9_9BASI|nr:hypothetical protein MNAN1_003794 [Malassezia nana]